VIDPSELLRPEPSFAKKPVAQFRDYTIDENDPIKERVRRTYKEMHTHQTVQFVQGILTSAMLLKLRHFEIKRRHFTSFYVRFDRNKLGPNT
jgi:inositol oxygenase